MALQRAAVDDFSAFLVHLFKPYLNKNSIKSEYLINLLYTLPISVFTYKSSKWHYKNRFTNILDLGISKLYLLIRLKFTQNGLHFLILYD